MPYRNYYIYKTDPKETTCERCSKNDGIIFEEDNLPLIPIHTNCRCTAKKVEPLPFFDAYLIGAKEGEYFLNDDFLPQERGRYWMRVINLSQQKIYYSNDGLIFLISNAGASIRQLQYNEGLYDTLYSLP